MELVLNLQWQLWKLAIILVMAMVKITFIVWAVAMVWCAAGLVLKLKNGVFNKIYTFRRHLLKASNQHVKIKPYINPF